MALAILEWMDADDSQVWFRVDTGTNTEYQLKVGRAVREDSDGEWVDDVYLSLPAARTKGSDNDPFGPPLKVSVPVARFEGGRNYAQLFTSKPGGRGQAASEVVLLPGLELGIRAGAPVARATSLSIADEVRGMTHVPERVPDYRKPRRVPNRMPSLARPASIESLLGELVKAATPAVTDLIKGAVGKATEGAPSGGPMDLIGQVLKTLLGTLTAEPAPKPADNKPETQKSETAKTEVAKTEVAPAEAKPADAAQVSEGKSIAQVVTNGVGNRFVAGGRARFARPMVFGVDDALIASLVGPVLQILPQLANAANQKRTALKKADNDLVGSILSDINKRMMMEKMLQAQATAQQQGNGAQLAQLQLIADLLANLPADAGTAKTQSLPVGPSGAIATPHKLSNRAVIEFKLGKSLLWNDAERVVFDRNHVMVLKPSFLVAAPAPKAPLPKAILKVVIQDAANPDMRTEKIWKLAGVMPNAPLECVFEPAELASLPQNAPLSVIAELRWRTARGESRAYGSTEIVLVNRFFVKTRGAEVSAERELTDMNQYRAFWNKVWEAPVLGQKRGETKKYNWELDVMAKYAAVLTASHDSNGFMETKLLQEASDRDSLIQLVRGRMKAGIELSVGELNKLVPGWPGNTALDADKLEALHARPFLESTARELKYQLRLKGRNGQGGMVWVIPTFKLFGITLSAVTGADASGQVTTTQDEVAPFPLPVAARLIGLKSAA